MNACFSDNPEVRDTDYYWRELIAAHVHNLCVNTVVKWNGRSRYLTVDDLVNYLWKKTFSLHPLAKRWMNRNKWIHIGGRAHMHVFSFARSILMILFKGAERSEAEQKTIVSLFPSVPWQLSSLACSIIEKKSNKEKSAVNGNFCHGKFVSSFYSFL